MGVSCYGVLLLFFLTVVEGVGINDEHYRLNISLAISNARTVIACGLSIDIYPLFDSARVIICPYVSLDKEQIQLINLNFVVENPNQTRIHVSSLKSSLSEHITLSNIASLPSNWMINQTDDRSYVSFSPSLTCRYTSLVNKATCFYYPVSSDLDYIEDHYDYIMNGGLNLSAEARFRFEMIFFIMTLLLLTMLVAALYILCSNQVPLRHISPLNTIIDSHSAKQEVAKQSAEAVQDGAVGQAVLAEHGNAREIDTIVVSW